MKSFAGKTAVVTGAASGIGREFARQLAAAGCHLALCDLDMAGLQATKTGLDKVNVTFHHVDVSDRARMFALVDEVLAAHAGVQVLINNAGIAAGGEFVAHDPAFIDKIVGVNLLGVLYGTRAFLPHLLTQPEAHIVNMSSMVGYLGLPGNTLYATTKFAVRGFSESLWAELGGTGVNLTVVHPGAIKTNVMRSAEFTQADDQEKLVALMDRFAMSPERAVRKILRAVQRHKMRQTICFESYALRFAERFAPGPTHWLLKRAFAARR